MLVNSNFTDPYTPPSQGHEDVMRVTGDKVTMIRATNISVPTGWLCMTRDGDGKYTQVEMQRGETKERMFDWHPSVKWFCRSRWYAGLLQVVDLEPGEYRLRAWAHAWNLHPIPGTEAGGPYARCRGNGLCSIGVENTGMPLGEGPYYAIAQDDERESGDPWKDGPLNITMRLVAGEGVNALPNTFGQAVHIYNRFSELPSLRFLVPEAGPVTLGLLADTKWHYENMDVYCGKMQLEAVELGVPHGRPRIQYDRIYDLLPQDIDPSVAAAIAAQVWAERRGTVGGSADDGGIGALVHKKVRLHGIALPRQDEFREFYNTYYPGTQLEFVDLPGGPIGPIDLQLTYPTTHTPPVITQEYHAGHTAIDLRSSWRYWKDYAVAALPGKVVENGWSDKFGWYLLTQTTMADGRLVELRYAHLAERSTIAKGQSVEAGQKIGMTDGTANPPVADHLHFSVRMNGKYVDPKPLIVWPGTIPDPPTPIPAVRNLMGQHLQTMVGGAMEYVAETGIACKVLASMEDVKGVLRANPDVDITWRHVTNNYGDTLEHPDPYIGAKNWLAKFGDALYDNCNAIAREFPNRKAPFFRVEGANEVYPPTERAMKLDRAWIHVLAETKLPVAPVVMTSAVGNPPEYDFEMLIDLARDCAAVDGAFGYHAYWMANRDDVDALDKYWPWLAGRWEEMDKVFVKAGVRVKWVFTEGGAVGGYFVPSGSATALAAFNSVTSIESGGIVKPSYKFVPIHKAPSLLDRIKSAIMPSFKAEAAATDGGFVLLPEDGWLSEKCYNGDWGRYLADMRRFNERAAATVAGREGRIIGMHVFTSGDGVGWQKFQIRDPQWQSMRQL